jgi:cytochrome c-type biogenesis protein CcmH
VTSRRLPLWTALGVLLVVALVVGSGVLSSSPPTPAQRALAIESALRCPSCEDLSVAQSSAATAVTVRATISQMISEGQTNQQIERYLVSRYGSTIVLDPPASGWSLLVWLLPIVGGLAALGALAVLLFRRRNAASATGVDPAGSDGGRAPTAEDTADQRKFLEQSLADADAEYLAGDLSDADYLALRSRDMRRLTMLDDAPAGGAGTAVVASMAVATADRAMAVVPAISATDSVIEPSESGRRRRNRWFLGGAVAAFGAAVVLAVFGFASGRQPGQSITGSFAETQQQQLSEKLDQAATDENQGQLDRAAQLYQSVITQYPDNEVALAQLGWLEYQTGRSSSSASVMADGRAKLNRAVELKPGDYAVRLYLGTVLFQQTGDSNGAVAQYRDFLADKPPTSVVSQAAPEMREVFEAAGQPVPAEIRA